MPPKKEGLSDSEVIIRLLILLLISKGVNLDAISDAIGLDKSTISRMVPQKNLKQNNK